MACSTHCIRRFPCLVESDRMNGSTLVFITRGIAAETLRAYAEKLAAD
jgi:hypothetical protein